MQALQSYVAGEWVAGRQASPLASAVTGAPVAELTSGGIDTAAMLAHAREVGGPALRRMTTHERALMLKALASALGEHRDELYALSVHAGCTRADAQIDVDGGIGVLFTYASKGRRELPDTHLLLDGPPETLAKDGSFAGLHVGVPLEGAAVHINAFNFPVWGMLEKLAPALLAGMPVITKPASPTAFVAAAAFRRIVESGVLPDGAVQLLVGSAGDLLDHLTCQDVVGFTGSASTAATLRTHPTVVAHSVRFTAEADSLNAAVLGPAATPGTPEFDAYVREVAREMTVKAGQKCTAIRRALVPDHLVDDVVAALADRLARVTIGDPARDDVRMGPLASLDQREEVQRAVAALREAATVTTGGDGVAVVGADADRGAFLAPTVLVAERPEAPAIHTVEAFGPVSTVVGYADLDHAVDLAARGGGSLVASVFTPDPGEARTLTLGIASHHGRVLVVDERCARTSTGHGSPLPHLVHGGPGRAGGGEELGGIRGVWHYLQRTAVQGSPDMLTAITGTWVPGASRREGPHPFTLAFDDLQVGDSVTTDEREVTLEDIAAFADLTGDHFYAHTDEEAARASGMFEGRVAHGYLVIALAAGLFVWPDPGPVLANYGLEHLRFTTPVYPGDRLHAVLTCKQKSLREGAGYGEVTWDVEITRGDGTVVAAYDLLTMVATRGG